VHDAAEKDLLFHDAVYRAAGHSRLLRLWRDLRPQVQMFMLARTYVSDPDFAAVMRRSHLELLSAIRAHEEELAQQVAVEHVQTSFRRVMEG